jgi:hypothetical protein
MQYTLPGINGNLVRVHSEDNNLRYLKRLSVSDDLPSAPINIHLSLGLSGWLMPQHHGQRASFFYVDSEHDEVYFEFPIPLGMKYKMLVKGLSTNSIEFNVSRSYWFARASLGTSSTGSARLFNVACMKLNALGYACLHGGFLERDGVGALIVAPSETGKTLTCLLSTEHGFKFGGDDLCVTDGKLVFPANLDNREAIYSGIYLSKVKPLPRWRLMALNGVFSSKLGYLMPGIAERLMGNRDLSGKLVTVPVPNRYIFFLRRGPSGAEELTRDEALRCLRLTQGAEFNWSNDPLILNHAYFNHAIGPDWRQAESIMESLVNNSEPCLITAEHPLEYIEVIDATVKRSGLRKIAA